MTVPGFPGITLKELRASKQPLESLPFPLNSTFRHFDISKYYFFARNGIYHGLKHFNIKPGDEVLMPELNSTIEPQVVRTLGAVPVFYKVLTSDPTIHDSRFTIHEFFPDWDDVRSKLTSKTKFFHLIHYLGVPNDIDTALEFCEKHNLIFFEDAAYGFLSGHHRRVENKNQKDLPLSTNHYPLTTALGSFGHFSVLCPRKTIPVPNGGILVINHGAWSMEHGTSEQYNSSQLQATSYKLQASYSSLWDWQYLLRNNRKEVTSEQVSRFERKHPITTPNLHTFTPSHLHTKSLFKHLLKDPFYVFHGSGVFNPKHKNWGMTTMAFNQLFKFDYPSIIQKNLENYTHVRDFCVNKGWDIFPHEIKPGTIPNAILLRIMNHESCIMHLKNKRILPDTNYMIQNDKTKNGTRENAADIISSMMLQHSIQLARPWQWNENLTTSRNLPSVDAYSGRGLILPIHYQLTREHLDYYLSLLSSLLP